MGQSSGNCTWIYLLYSHDESGWSAVQTGPGASDRVFKGQSIKEVREIVVGHASQFGDSTSLLFVEDVTTPDGSRRGEFRYIKAGE